MFNVVFRFIVKQIKAVFSFTATCFYWTTATCFRIAVAFALLYEPIMTHMFLPGDLTMTAHDYDIKFLKNFLLFTHYVTAFFIAFWHRASIKLKMSTERRNTGFFFYIMLYLVAVIWALCSYDGMFV